MTKERRAKEARERVINGVSFYTVLGLGEQLPGRVTGTHTSPRTILQYVAEGCPCFEHGGMILFEKNLGEFLTWLRNRRPVRKLKASERLRRIYGR